MNDEGTYATVGHAIWSDHALLYEDVWENKPPAIYVLYGALDRLTGVAHLLLAIRLVALALGLLLTLLAYGLPRLLGLDHGRALLSMLLAGTAFSLPLLEGTTANAETFMAPLALAGLTLCWSASRGRWTRGVGSGALLAGGLLLGAALLFKAVAAMDVTAALLLIALAPRSSVSSRAPAGGRRGRMLLVAAGALIPPLLTLVGFAVHGTGALGALWWSTLGYNLAYIGAGGGGGGARLVGAALLLAALAVVVRWYAIAARRPQAERARNGDWRQAGLALWSGCAAVGVLAGGRPHVHYALQLVAPLACLVGALVPPRLARYGAAMAAVSAAPIILAVVLETIVAATGGPRAVARAHRLSAYYAGVWWVATGQQTAQGFAADLDSRVNGNVAVAAFLRGWRGGPRGCRAPLFVWGNAPWIYYLSGLPPAMPFTSVDYTPPPAGEAAQVARVVHDGQAGAIVLLDVRHHRARAAALEEHYRQVSQVEGSAVFTRCDPRQVQASRSSPP